MGMLAENKSRKKISNDPNNTKWTRDETTFGQKILRSQGWQPGQFLGAQNAPHSELHTAANASYIRVVLKDDMKGLGFNKAKDDEVTGLDVFSDLLSRLNGRSEESLESEKQAKLAVKTNFYVAQKYGAMRFVSGGLLVGDKLVDSNKPDDDEDEDSEGDAKMQDAAAAETKKSKKDKKRKATEDEEEEDDSTSKKKRRKDDDESRKSKKDKKKSKKERSKSEPVSEDDDESASADKKKKRKSKKSKDESDDDDEAKAAKKKLKKEKKEKKKEKKEKKKRRKAAASSDDEDGSSSSATEQSTGTSTPVTSASGAATGTSTPLRSRNFVRSRFIAQKKQAVLDAKALNQIFMLKT